jgi:anaerobic ribonucleoside-triphosphate reductase activating protein
MAKLKIAGIVKNSIVDGPGLRYTIFTQGCYHNCEGCQNPQTHNPTDGKFIDTDEIYNEIIKDPVIAGVTFSGGEPFLQSDALAELALKINNAGMHTLDIICYTGFTYEEILKIIKDGCKSYLNLLHNIDYLIDGRFEKDKVSLDCAWRGSTNQRIIDVRKSIREGKVVEIEL